MKTFLINILFLAIFITAGFFILREFKKYGERFVYIYNNPPSVNNLVFNSIYSWKYILDSIPNTRISTYPDTSQNSTLYDLTQQATIVFRFSGNMCTPCVDFVIDRIKFCIQDFKDNENILFLYSDANPAQIKNKIVKKSWYISKSFHQELDNLWVSSEK